MRAVVVLAVAGIVALTIAALTGSTPLALVVVALAAAGIIQLLRDWRSERAREQVAAAAGGEVRPTGAGAVSTDAGAVSPGAVAMSPDEFSPDISTNPDGPSSDARADQG